jgi:hypothetical protein
MKVQFNTTVETMLAEMAFGLGSNIPVTIDQFVGEVINFNNAKKGTTPISFTSVTNPQYRKTGCAYKKIYKVGQTNGMIGFDYESNVNAQREREGKAADFVKQQMSNVKEWLSDSVGITNTGLRVIAYRPLTSLPAQWVAEDHLGRLVVCEPEEITPLLYTPSGTGQGVDKTVEYRLYGTDKIVAASLLKKEYLITDVDPVRKDVFELVKHRLRS